MQTFLPLSDYKESMRCLDKTRLGNQVWREGLTLIRGRWPNHPASKMWRGYEYHLGLYLLAGCDVLLERGNDYPEIRNAILNEMSKFENTGSPPWLANPEFHASHRSNLLRKVKLARQKAELTKKKSHINMANYMELWYSQFKWSDPDNLPYIWPKQKDRL